MHNLKRLALIFIPLSLPTAAFAAPATPDDYDGDGLPNAAELRIAEQFVAHGFPAVSPTNAYSLGQAVPDYWLPVGLQYLGAMFTDHDLLPDDWERQYGLSTIAFDTWIDPDSDGWCNYAEFMATTDPASLTNAPVPTIAVRASLEHGHLPLYGVALVVRAGRATWRPSSTSDGRTWLATLGEPASGHVDEGPCVIEAWADSNGDGLWTPGEPYGSARADIGWAGTAVEVELTDTSSSILRMDVDPLVSASGGAEADRHTDRGVTGETYYQDMVLPFVRTNTSHKVMVPINIMRGWFNDDITEINSIEDPENRAAVLNDYLTNVTETVFERTFKLGGHPTVTEADLMARGELELDWNTLLSAWQRIKGSKSSLTNVAYRIVLSDRNDPGVINELNDIVPIVFFNAFERGLHQTPATPVSASGVPGSPGIVYAGQPAFTWTHEAKDANGRKIKDYPAFCLRVWTAQTGDEPDKLVYDSGDQPAPARNVVDGTYSWTAPIYANMVTPQGKIFATTNNYWWSVSMIDAKFREPGSDETRQAFRLETSGALDKISDYGAIKACVRYYGPATVTATATALTNIIRVQAFTSPDFTGVPAGEAYVTTTNGLNSTTDATTPNALILGVKPGTYYLRAFVDSDGDCAWSRWETWGYANYVGTDAKKPYTPCAMTVAKGAPVPMATIFMEDMDTDRDHMPDTWEWNYSKSLVPTNAPTGNSFFTRVNPELVAIVNAYTLENASKETTPLRLQSVAGSVSGVPDSSNEETLPLRLPLMNAALFLPPAVAEKLADPNAVQVTIASFSLADGVSLKVSSDLTPGDYGAVVVNENATVDLYLVAAKTPDFADAREVLAKTITIKANEAREIVTAAELKALIEEAGLGDAAFFKVRLQATE